MNEETGLLGRIVTYIGLLMAPPAAILAIYAHLHDLKIGRHPSVKPFAIAEVVLIGYSIFAYWLIKRMGWDFWNEHKSIKK
ncbi:MAG: hypothetical protein ACXVCQ_18955 [Bacteriovorax sp.]